MTWITYELADDPCYGCLLRPCCSEICRAKFDIVLQDIAVRGDDDGMEKNIENYKQTMPSHVAG